MSHDLPHVFPSSTDGIELFDEFFESGSEESVSPFLKPRSRAFGKHLPLKSSLIAAFFLLLSPLISFFPSISHFSTICLVFSYFFAGVPALIGAIEDIVDLEINIDVLMTLAAFLSVIIGSGWEGALLLVLFSFSEALGEAISSKAKGSIRSLKQLSPQKAYVVQEDGHLIERSVKDIGLNTKIHVKAGEIVPLDGTVIEGSSSVNMAHLTGESLPKVCAPRDPVFQGTRNIEGALTIEVTHTSSDSTIARIIQLITQAQEAKPKLQRFFDTFSNRYATTIILLSALFAIGLPFFFPISFIGTEGSIYRSLAFLIAASPCALIIAMPIAYLSAISACAREGILLKGGVVLDALARCKTIAFDKTGTLTTGNLSCLGIEEFGKKEKDLLSLALTLERSSVHPMAKAIIAFAESKKTPFVPITDFQFIPGYGLTALYQGKEVFLGHTGWILPKLSETLRQTVETALTHIHALGELVTLLVYDQSVLIFRFYDTLRSKTRSTMEILQKELGIRLLMLTGDHEESARSIAKEALITEFYANLRPEEKVAHIAKETHIAMVGDGINDAPALARATVGISMGKGGSSTAIDASDIVFLQDKIERIVWLVKKSREVVRIVRENVSVALAAILFATIPALLGWVPLWLAVIVHEGGTVLVALNALRLLKRK